MDFPAPYSTGHPQPYPTDEPAEAVKAMPPLVAAAADLHEVETSMASLSERMHDLEEQRHRMLDKRQALRAEARQPPRHG